MITWNYDGTFQGFLTLVYHSWTTRTRPDAITTPWRRGEHFLGETCSFQSHQENSSRVWNYILSKLSSLSQKRMYRAFLQDQDHTELLVMRYLALGVNHPGKVDQDLVHPVISKICEAGRSVMRERELLLGLVRFRKLGEVYYCPLEPQYRPFPLMGDHFSRRYADMPWIIHDLKREEALMFLPYQSWCIGHLSGKDVPSLSGEEEAWQTMWRDYYRAMGIEGRKNPKLRQRFMPKKYWKHLVEME